MSEAPRSWWVYALRTATGQIYCGISTDVAARLATHNRGQGARFLRGGRLPCTLLASWRFEGEDAHGDALRAEAWFKRQPTARKWRIVRGEEGLG